MAAFCIRSGPCDFMVLPERLLVNERGKRYDENMKIPENVKRILSDLNTAGFEAYAVGGCVRDMLLGREPEDWDVTTNAKPQEVKKIFRRTIDTGIEHGTVTVMFGKTGYEITTYRVDGNYSDARHPDRVIFTPSLSEDLKRRDFTINAMAYSERDGLTDLFGGQKDLKEKTIRCVGNPDERFTEDALRILRAVRFSAQLGFSIEEATEEALKRHAPNLAHVSRERIFAELNKALLSDHPEKMRMITDTGMAPFIAESFEEIIPSEKIAGLPKEKYIRWAAAFRSSSAAALRNILRSLRSDNETLKRAVLLCGECKKSLPADKTEVRIRLSEIGPDRFDDLICLSREGFGTEPNAEEISAAEKNKKEVIADGECCSLSMLKFSGEDLIEAGIKPGPEVGKTLNRLFREVLNHPEYNTKEKLKSML